MAKTEWPINMFYWSVIMKSNSVVYDRDLVSRQPV